MANDQNQKPETPADDQADPSQRDATEVDAAAADLGETAQILSSEILSLRGKLARWQADFSNLQRRSAQEISLARQNADADFAKALLTVLDHFDMALSIDPARVDAAAVLNGVKITYDELQKTLAQRGIVSFDPTGQPFDPHQHEAVMQEAAAGKPPMTVLQTLQAGYKLGDRVLRPAKVKVSK